MNDKSYQIGDCFSFKRIGKTIYVLEEGKEEENLYEFEDEGFYVVRSILDLQKFRYSELRNRLIIQYKFDEIDDDILEEFLDQLTQNGILCAT